VAFLSLILATNFVPWIQLAERATDSTTPGESVLVIASCFLAAGFVIAAWLLGRRLPPGRGPQFASPRDAGLALAVLVAGLNLTLAAIIHWRTTGGSVSLHDELAWFGVVWYALVLPAQVAAGYCKGRASIPIPGDALPARSSGPTERSPGPRVGSS
jgi:hypothetical protein